MQNGDIKNFRLSNQCSAGNGMLLQAMADQFGVAVTDYADVAFEAKLSPKFSYGCAVFLDSDRVNFQKEGYSKEELLAGLAQVLPKNVWQYVVQIPRVVMRKGRSTFIGIDNAINLEYTSKNDEETRCHFCPNLCARTFIDTKTPDGGTSRYISGFSCEKGTVESEEAMLALTKERKQIMKQFPNLVDYESKQVFRHFYDPEPMPEATQMVSDMVVEKTFLGVKKTAVKRTFRRSTPESWQARRVVRIGIPKVLNIWTLAPFFRTYLETL